MRREDRALSLLQNPMTNVQLAKAMDISRAHVNGILRRLRDAQRIHVRGECDGKPLWAQIGRRRASPRSEAESLPYERRRWLETNLDLWARAMKAYWGPEGYPQASAGFPARARIHSFEDLEEESDRWMVAMIDARIDELGDRDRTAIYYSCGLTHVWPYVDHPADAADSARECLVEGLRKWTAVP